MLKVYTLDDCEEWDDIVKSFDDYDVYYLSGYTRAFQLHGDGMPHLFYYSDANIRAINVVMKRDIHKSPHFSHTIQPNNLFDLTTPYGYGGFLMEGEMTADTVKPLYDAYTLYCQRHNIVSEIVRFNPLTNNQNQVIEYFQRVPLGETITIELNSLEQIWRNFKSNNRRNIKKAQKSGVQIYWGRSPELLDTFQEIYNVTMERDEANAYYFFEPEFYESILHDLPYNSLIFYAMLDGEMISMAIILFANHKMHYHLSGSRIEYNHIRPSNLLMYEVAKWGLENGFRRFHLGGGLGSSEDNLLRYKASFNRHSDTSYAIGKQIFMKEAYEELVSLRQQTEDFDETSSFFPKYRA